MVLVSTTTPDIAGFQDTIAKLSAEYVDWTLRTVDLSLKGFNNDSVYFAFVNITNDGYKLYIDDIRVWKEDPVSVNELSMINQVEVFPNPTSDFIQINTKYKYISSSIYSLNGTKILDSTDKKIAVNKLQNGVYFVKIITDKSTFSVRFLKN
jgi:hypothetical protein